MGVRKFSSATAGPTSRRVLPPGKYDRYQQYEDIDKAAVCIAGCQYELIDVTFCQIITLALVC